MTKSIQKEIEEVLKECSLRYKSIEELTEADWLYIRRCKELSEDFIREFIDKMEGHWDTISQYQVLSENFIRDFRGKVCWKKISLYQQLSEYFIKEFADRLYWPHILNSQTLSKYFLYSMREYRFVFLYKRRASFCRVYR